MCMENYRMVAGLIAAHKDRKVVGRTRLQKEVKLLQRLGVPTDYNYTIHFYGPYSDGLQADIGLQGAFGLVTEELIEKPSGDPYYVLTAHEAEDLPEVVQFEHHIHVLSETPTVVLELAATYDAFREMGADHDGALERLHRKKGSKCNDGRDEQALELLEKLKLPVH